MNAPAFWTALQSAEAKVVARVRAVVGLIAGGALAPALMVDSPAWVKPVGGGVFAVCLALALLMRAGKDQPPSTP